MLEFIKRFNFILACDSYKAGHWQELPAGTLFSNSVIVPRKPSKYAEMIVAMGQTYVAEFMAGVRITMEDVDEAEREINEQGYDFNREGWEIIVREFGGALPLAIYAVEEGRIIAPQAALMSVINTDARFAWLPAYVETIVQCTIWKMSTVASVCRAARITLLEFLEKTGDPDLINYKLHNFGDRGADSPNEAPVIAGIAHAALFDGSDCTRANGYIKKMYRADRAYTSSVEATEHSVMCANSDAAARDDFGAAKMAVDRLLAVVERTNRGIGVPLMSVVIDTYDSRRFVRDYMGGVFKETIQNSGGVMVFRPDSGDPTVEPGMVARDVEATFGASINSKGYKVLAPCTSVIQGDGIRIDTIRPVLQGWVDAGYSTNSLVLGMGAGITHFGARDDFSFSMKAVALCDENGWRRLLKEPITDLGKKSLSGLVRNKEDKNGILVTYDCLDNPAEFFQEGPGWRLWYKNGERQFIQTFDSVRNLARL
jgi:nicotinamide phosphoribosyltransferase